MNHAVVIDEQHLFADADLDRQRVRTGCSDGHHVGRIAGRIAGGRRRVRGAVTRARRGAQSDEQEASLSKSHLVDPASLIVS